MKSRLFGMLVYVLAVPFMSANVLAQAAGSSSGGESVAANAIETLSITQQSGSTIIKVGLKP